MKRREIEDRIRRHDWPEPPAELRARVLSAAAARSSASSADAAGDRPARVSSDPEARRPVGAGVPWTGVAPARAWQRAAGIAAVVVVLSLGGCAGFDVWAGHGLEAEIAHIEARYGSLDASAFQVPKVPDQDNRAHVVRAAAALTVRPSSYFWVNPVTPSPLTAELIQFVEANRAAIRTAGDIRARSQSNWDLEHQDVAYAVPWSTMNVLSTAIFMASMEHLDAGRADEAASTIVSGLGVAASMRQEPSMVLQQMRMGLASRPFMAVRRLLIESAPSAAALEEVARWLAENRVPDAMRLALLNDIRETNSMFARMENGQMDGNTVSYLYPMTWPRGYSVLVPPAALIGRPFVRVARVRYLRHMEQLLDAELGPRPRPALPEPEPPKRWALLDRLTEKFTAQTESYSDRGDDFMSQLGAAELAVALRRFRLDRGDYPDELSALVPAYLASVPGDPYTGRPIAYARQGAGFTLRATASRPELTKYFPMEWDVAK